jgi:N-acetylmuramoyl-L-alanine amidase
MTVVVDAGHQLGNAEHLFEIDRLVNGGGFRKPCNTTGTATDGGFPEATFTWDVALDLRAKLEREGARVFLTRHDNSYADWGPCVNVRGRFGNRVGADAVVSIHGDGAPSSYRGFFVTHPGLRPGWTDDIQQSSHRLAVDVHAGLISAGAVVANDHGGTGYSTRTDLGTLNWSNVPVVMVELGNMRNPTDAAHMTSPAYRRSVYARGLATGVTTFLMRR